MQQLDVVGIRLDVSASQTLVLLREVEGERVLPIWIGAAEATAIAYAQQGVVPPRPLTHDLFRDVIAALGKTLAEVRITELRDGIFFAVLVFVDSGSEPPTGRVEVSARPSDAIALALRTGTRIYGSEEVLDEAGVEVQDEQEDEVERFRDFLDNISPDDFGGAPPPAPPAE